MGTRRDTPLPHPLPPHPLLDETDEARPHPGPSTSRGARIKPPGDLALPSRREPGLLQSQWLPPAVRALSPQPLLPTQRLPLCSGPSLPGTRGRSTSKTQLRVRYPRASLGLPLSACGVASAGTEPGPQGLPGGSLRQEMGCSLTERSSTGAHAPGPSQCRTPGPRGPWRNGWDRDPTGMSGRAQAVGMVRVWLSCPPHGRGWSQSGGTPSETAPLSCFKRCEAARPLPAP